MIDVAVDEAEIQRALGATAVHLDLDALLQLAEAASPRKPAAPPPTSVARPRATGRSMNHGSRRTSGCMPG